MNTIYQWLIDSSRTLSLAGIESARLDAELILAHTIRRSRTYLHSHGEENIDERREDIANARLGLRLERTPIAYIIGHKEFYGRKFKTTPAALIPRPESETMIDMLKELIDQNRSLLLDQQRLIDVGTGTGCLGITAKLEWPNLDVTLIDISNHALNLAKDNARVLGADVEMKRSDLLHGYSVPVDIILANLPYVDRRWHVSPETHAEPEQALYSDEDGLSLIKKLIRQSSSIINPRGHLLIESDPRQHKNIVSYAKNNGFEHIRTEGYICLFTH